MISRDDHEKYLQEVKRRIEEADKLNKEKADAILKAMANNYHQKVSEQIEVELSLIEECRRIGDDFGARHHTTLVEVYKSMLNNQQIT